MEIVRAVRALMVIQDHQDHQVAMENSNRVDHVKMAIDQDAMAIVRVLIDQEIVQLLSLKMSVLAIVH
jgi:hypothetical protein